MCIKKSICFRFESNLNGKIDSLSIRIDILVRISFSNRFFYLIDDADASPSSIKL